MNCEMNKYILSYKNIFIDYYFIINDSKNVININISILKIAEWENVKLLDKYDNFAIMQNILHILQLCNELLSLTYINIKQDFDIFISNNFMIFINEYIYIEINIIDELYFISINQYNIITYIAILKWEIKLCIWYKKYDHAANSIIIIFITNENVKKSKILGNSKQNAHDMNIYIDCVMKKIHKSFFSFINNKYAKKEILIHFNIYKSM